MPEKAWDSPHLTLHVLSLYHLPRSRPFSVGCASWEGVKASRHREQGLWVRNKK